MKKVQIVILAAGFIGSVGIMALLYKLSPLSHDIYRGGFERRFTGQALVPDATINLEVNSFYIAGSTDSALYLGNATAPFHLLKTNLALTDSQHVMLHVKLDSISDPYRFRLWVTPFYFYLAHGVEPVILRGDFNSWTAVPFMTDKGYYFSDALPLSGSSFALRSYSRAAQGYELAKKTVDGFEFHDDLLQKQIDGMFCVDGKMTYNRMLKKLVYVYFYRNQFIVADTNLVLNYRGHTIDTFSHAQIKVAKIGAGTESMISSPPMLVNGLSCTDGDMLFIQSVLLANNEAESVFRSGVTVDCYRLSDGQYLWSFHIPKYRENTLSSFQVVDHKLYGVFGRYLVRFDLDAVTPAEAVPSHADSVLARQYPGF